MERIKLSHRKITEKRTLLWAIPLLKKAINSNNSSQLQGNKVARIMSTRCIRTPWVKLLYIWIKLTGKRKTMLRNWTI
jgi:hypothetical protein